MESLSLRPALCWARDFPDVVVLFTCHWFAHSMKWDERAPIEIPREEIFDNRIERRVLDKERYELSRRFLPQLVKELDQRQIRFAGASAANFFIAEDLAPEAGSYAVFFEIRRDRRRKKRMLLYVQSAYRLDRLTKRLVSARKIRFRKLLRSTYFRESGSSVNSSRRKDNGHQEVAVACEAQGTCNWCLRCIIRMWRSALPEHLRARGQNRAGLAKRWSDA